MANAVSPQTPTDLGTELGARAAKINERLEALEVKVDLWDSVEREPHRALLAELKEDQAAVADMLRDLRSAAGEEWRALSDRTRRAFDRLESEVHTAWADVEAEMADDADTFRAASARQLDTWRGHVDRMRLQAKLAEMEARDAFTDLERAFEAARPELDQARDAADDALTTIRTKSREMVGHLRAAARDASRKMA